jgi:hypothetical protein
MTVVAKLDTESVEEASVTELLVGKALGADPPIGDAVFALQNTKEPVDCNNALEARSRTRVAITPGLDESLSRVWEKLDEEACIGRELAKVMFEFDETEMLTSTPDDESWDVMTEECTSSWASADDFMNYCSKSCAENEEESNRNPDPSTLGRTLAYFRRGSTSALGAFVGFGETLIRRFTKRNF